MKIHVKLSIGYSTACQEDLFDITEIGYTADEWNALSEEMQQKALDAFAEDWASNYIDAFVEVIP